MSYGQIKLCVQCIEHVSVDVLTVELSPKIC